MLHAKSDRARADRGGELGTVEIFKIQVVVINQASTQGNRPYVARPTGIEVVFETCVSRWVAIHARITQAGAPVAGVEAGFVAIVKATLKGRTRILGCYRNASQDVFGYDADITGQVCLSGCCREAHGCKKGGCCRKLSPSEPHFHSIVPYVVREGRAPTLAPDAGRQNI